MSLFVTFEGIEGSGKSTHLRLLADALRTAGHAVVETREPGGTAWDSAARAAARAVPTPPAPLAELLLYCADRAQHIEQVIRPALAAGQVVLCDRFSDSTLAYQGYARGLSLETVRALDAEARGGLEPDLTFLLDCPPATGVGRARARPATAIGSSRRHSHSTRPSAAASTRSPPPRRALPRARHRCRRRLGSRSASARRRCAPRRRLVTFADVSVTTGRSPDWARRLPRGPSCPGLLLSGPAGVGKRALADAFAVGTAVRRPDRRRLRRLRPVHAGRRQGRIQTCGSSSATRTGGTCARSRSVS